MTKSNCKETLHCEVFTEAWKAKPSALEANSIQWIVCSLNNIDTIPLNSFNF